MAVASFCCKIICKVYRYVRLQNKRSGDTFLPDLLIMEFGELTEKINIVSPYLLVSRAD